MSAQLAPLHMQACGVSSPIHIGQDGGEGGGKEEGGGGERGKCGGECGRQKIVIQKGTQGTCWLLVENFASVR